jgi:hypothetical protein
MSKKIMIALFLGTAVFTVGILAFIHFNNDHIECENAIEFSAGQNGEKISSQRHICKERFSL